MKKNVLINFFSSNSGGGLSVALNFISNLKLENDFILIVRKGEYLDRNRIPNVSYIAIGGFLPLFLLNIIVYYIVVPLLTIFKSRCVLLNFGDLVPLSFSKHVYYFDWAFLSADYSLFSGGFLDRLKRFSKKVLIRGMLWNVNEMICQTNVQRTELLKYFSSDNVSVIPNFPPVYYESEVCFFKKDSHFKYFFCFSRYYSHKNLEILIPAAIEIKKRNLNFRFVITIDANQGRRAKDFLHHIDKCNVLDVFVNIGEIRPDCIRSVYNSVDFSLLPTLLESYSTTYVESIIYEIPILTSNFDFAKEVCGDAAVYFDPLSPVDIVDKMEFVSQSHVSTRLISSIQENKKKLLSSEVIVSKILKVIEGV